MTFTIPDATVRADRPARQPVGLWVHRVMAAALFPGLPAAVVGVLTGTPLLFVVGAALVAVGAAAVVWTLGRTRDRARAGVAVAVAVVVAGAALVGPVARARHAEHREWSQSVQGRVEDVVAATATTITVVVEGDPDGEPSASLVSFDRRTGERLPPIALVGVYSDPDLHLTALDDRLVVSHGGSVWMVDTAEGKVVWTHDREAGQVFMRPVAASDDVVVFSELPSDASSTRLVARDGADGGAVVWESSLVGVEPPEMAVPVQGSSDGGGITSALPSVVVARHADPVPGGDDVLVLDARTGAELLSRSRQRPIAAVGDRVVWQARGPMDGRVGVLCTTAVTVADQELWSRDLPCGAVVWGAAALDSRIIYPSVEGDGPAVSVVLDSGGVTDLPTEDELAATDSFHVVHAPDDEALFLAYAHGSDDARWSYRAEVSERFDRYALSDTLALESFSTDRNPFSPKWDGARNDHVVVLDRDGRVTSSVRGRVRATLPLADGRAVVLLASASGSDLDRGEGASTVMLVGGS